MNGLPSKKTTVELRSLVMQAVSEALNDPDLGLELRDSFKARLRKISRSRSKKTIPLEEIKKKYY